MGTASIRTDCSNDINTKLKEYNEEVSDIAQMFNGRSVFITGGSGFIGRVLIEKLLRCYLGIHRIYILMRPKKNESPNERLRRVLDVPLFDKVRSMEEDGGYKLLDKIIVVHGDIAEPQLGIGDSNMHMLLDDSTLSIVFHSAATTKFDAPLKDSVQLNLIATKSIIELCKKLKNLISFCHVSTAYVNSHLPDRVKIEEKLYPISQSPQQVIKLAEILDGSTMQLLKSAFIASRPNTYTYTKALAEHLIAMEASDLPVAIVRPSIVVASWREPMPGWVDNINGPSGLIVALIKGLLRTMQAVTSCKAEMIPVDVVVNTVIASAYYAAKIDGKLGSCREAIERVKVLHASDEAKLACASSERTSSKELPIFHCNSGDLKPINWGDSREIAFPIIRHYPSVQTYRYPSGTFKNNKYHDLITRFFVHLLPALILDSISGFIGKKRKLMWIYGKLHAAIAALSPFTLHEFNFQTKNIQLLRDTLNGVDREQLFMDIENISWPLFWHDYVLGCRRYILKEDDKSLERARKDLKKAYWIEIALRAGAVIILALSLVPLASY